MGVSRRYSVAACALVISITAFIAAASESITRATPLPPIAGEYLFFEYQTDCSGLLDLEVSGSNHDFHGRIHSNGGIKLNGSNNQFGGEITYDEACGLDHSGSNNEPDPLNEEALGDGLPFAMPIGDDGDGFEWEDIPCAGIHDPSAGLYWYNEDLVDVNDKPELWVDNDPNTKQFKPNIVVCVGRSGSTVGGELRLTDQGVTGTVTLAAKERLDLSGSDPQLTGYWNDILLYAASDADAAIKAAGAGDADSATAELTGFVHAPRGRVKLEVSSAYSARVSVIAARLQIAGSNGTFEALHLDTDTDGCADVRETGDDESLGGERDPASPWDFFDVPVPASGVGTDGKPTLEADSVRNRAISLQDVGVVLAYVGRRSTSVYYSGDHNADGIPDGQQLDRTPSTIPEQIWRSGPPDGAISLQDVGAALAQVGHSCITSP